MVENSEKNSSTTWLVDNEMSFLLAAATAPVVASIIGTAPIFLGAAIQIAPWFLAAAALSGLILGFVGSLVFLATAYWIASKIGKSPPIYYGASVAAALAHSGAGILLANVHSNKLMSLFGFVWERNFFSSPIDWNIYGWTVMAKIIGGLCATSLFVLRAPMFQVPEEDF